MSQLPFYAAAVVAGRIALTGVVLAVAVCCVHLKRLEGVRLHVVEGLAFVLAVVLGAVVHDLMIAALVVLALLGVVVVPVAASR
jgi:hypothetical protein